MNINLSLPKVSLPTWQQVMAAGRNISLGAAGFVGGVASATGLAVTMHLMSQGDASKLVGAFTDLSTGIQSIVSGLGLVGTALVTIFGFVVTIWSTMSASPKTQAQSVVENIPGTQIIGPQSLADATPGHDAIKSQDKFSVVEKAS